MAIGWEAYGSPETGTGTLTLPQPAPTPGEEAPNFSAETVSGQTFEVKDKGTYVVTFWSILNQGSSQSRPAFARLAREYSDSEVAFAAIYVSNMSGQPEEAPYALLQDNSGRLTSLYNVKRVPRLFLIKDGRIVLVHNTYHEDNEMFLEKELQRLAEEESAGSS
jgi:thiol-disulfide isomerase/thioredoxin